MFQFSRFITSTESYGGHPISFLRVVEPLFYKLKFIDFAKIKIINNRSTKHIFRRSTYTGHSNLVAFSIACLPGVDTSAGSRFRFRQRCSGAQQSF